MALTVVLSLVTNMAIDFVVAIGIYHALRRWGRDKSYTGWMVE